jgi:hypothetical protein
MQVFWSWQNDTPAETGRDLIRSALEAAAKQADELASAEIFEPTAQDRGSDGSRHRKPKLDHLDAARKFREQIGQSVAFVADVTPFVASAGVGSSHASPRVNSDVSLELGCALGVLGSERTFLILNEYYGKLTDLPFRLRGKVFHVNLPPSADEQTIEAEAQNLTVALIEFIRSAAAEGTIAEVKDLGLLVKTVDRMIFLADWPVGIFVGALSLWPLLALLISSITSINMDHFLWPLTFGIYFASWIFGVGFDKSHQDDAFVAGANQGRVNWRDKILLFGIVGIFIMIFMVQQIHNNKKIFEGRETIMAINGIYESYGCIIFLGFVHLIWLINIVLWRFFLRDYIDRMIYDSKKKLEHRYIFANLDKLYGVEAYIKGRWQLHRFIFGFGFLAIIDFFVLYLIWNEGLANGFAAVETSWQFYVLMFAFVVLVESWVGELGLDRARENVLPSDFRRPYR